MNYLSHAYLSFEDPAILTGNMMGDYVKGRSLFSYPKCIQRGIMLHRHIDAFTDAHSATKEAKKIFQPHYRLYAAALVDVIFDHFLANDPAYFSDASLQRFAASCYQQLSEHEQYFPLRFATMFSYMRAQNWLYHYRFTHGVEKSLGGLVRRAKYMPASDVAFQLFHTHYTTLQACYQSLFPDLHRMATELR